MKKKKTFKILAVLVLVVIIIISLALCGDDTDNMASDNEWAIYLYLCGSDLESEYGAATNDLAELLEVQLPENVKVVIQTGGANQWQNEFVSSEFLERYVYDSNGLQLVDQQPLASMGSQEALSDFLAFAKENYPSDKTAFMFWNHGGGSVAGAAFDQIYSGDGLTLDEMYLAFDANYELSEENPPFELIGFDTCLMATVDVAYTYSDIGKYLVASQELEPGNGWYYTGWGEALAEDPTMDGLEFGKVICDSYQEGCELVGTQDEITLSVTNLSKIPEFIRAYDQFGKEALISSTQDPSFFSNFGRIAFATENYGGNTKEQGFTNMVDLGHLARQSADMLPKTSASILASLEDCVEYKVNGPYRAEATGLSCYYSFNGDVNDFNKYVGIGAGEAFKYYYAYGLTGELSEDGMKYIAETKMKSLPPLNTLESQGWEHHPIEVDSDGSAILKLGRGAQDILTSVNLLLYIVDIDEDIMLLLGRDNDLYGDWENGVFKDNFRGVWGGINGNLVYMEIVAEGDGYNLYSVPILLNGEEYNLSVVYDFEKEAYEIQGARKPIYENGMADKNLRYLVEGDIITTIHYGRAISDDGIDITPVEIDEIKVDDDLVFEEIDLGDGMYMMLYEMQDMQGYIALSDIIIFDIEDGNISTSTMEVE